MTKELIERLRDTASKGVSVWGDLQMEAAKEIEILTAEREAYASAMDRMKAELAAIKNQEPVAWRMDWINHGPSFTADKSDYVTWFAGKESYPKELVPLFAAPVPELRGVTDAQGLPSMAAPAHTTGESSGHPTPPVQEPLSDNAIAALRQAIVQPARQVPTTNYVQPVPDHCDRITWRNRYYHLPLAAALPYGPRPKFGAIGSRDVDVAEAQRAWDKAMAAQPAQVPAELSLNIIRKWPDGFQKRLDHVWKDVDGFIPNVKLYDLQRTLAEFGFTMKVYEQAAPEVK